MTALVLGALAVHPVSAQITTGTVAGSVKDDQGLAVPGASVTLISEARATRMAPIDGRQSAVGGRRSVWRYLSDYRPPTTDRRLEVP
jgi:hypothetical protein